MQLRCPGYGEGMTQEHESLTDKARDVADAINDKLEPDPAEQPQRPLGNDASDPFANDRRPDETGFAHGSVAGVEGG